MGPRYNLVLTVLVWTAGNCGVTITAPPSVTGSNSANLFPDYQSKMRLSDHLSSPQLLINNKLGGSGDIRGLYFSLTISPELGWRTACKVMKSLSEGGTMSWVVTLSCGGADDDQMYPMSEVSSVQYVVSTLWHTIWHWDMSLWWAPLHTPSLISDSVPHFSLIPS